MNRWDITAAVEYRSVLAAGRVFGVDYVIRYLRAPSCRVVPRLLRAFGATVGERVSFKYALNIDNAGDDFTNLIIGSNCYIGDGVYFDLADRVTIGNDCAIAGRASFVTHQDCSRSAWLNERMPRQTAPVKVGDGSFVGFGATLLMGSTVGERGVLAAHSLLRGTVPEESVYAGPSAKLQRNIV